MFGQHLVESYEQARPGPSHTETGKLTQTFVCQYPPCGPGHMTSVQCRISSVVRFVSLLGLKLENFVFILNFLNSPTRDRVSFRQLGGKEMLFLFSFLTSHVKLG